MRTCTKCRESKPTESFFNPKHPWCRQCKTLSGTNRRKSGGWEREKKQRQEHREMNREKYNSKSRKQYRELKSTVIAGYGGSCACCGENEPSFLCLDHVFGGGGRERKTVQGQQIYWKVKRLGFPAEYQLLCLNCNWAKYKGGCPHGNPAGQPRKIP